MNNQPVPEPWASRMRTRGFTRSDGEPNVTRLAAQTGLAVETVRRAVHGIGTPTPDTVAALAEVLGSDVQEWTGQTVETGPYIPPRESALLDRDQRDALDQLIRVMARGQIRRIGIEPAAAPSLPSLRAAKKGTSAGRAARREQDEDADRDN